MKIGDMVIDKFWSKVKGKKNTYLCLAQIVDIRPLHLAGMYIIKPLWITNRFSAFHRYRHRYELGRISSRKKEKYLELLNMISLGTI